MKSYPLQPAIKEFEDSEFDIIPTIDKKIADLIKDGRSDEAKKFVTACTK